MCVCATRQLTEETVPAGWNGIYFRGKTSKERRMESGSLSEFQPLNDPSIDREC